MHLKEIGLKEELCTGWRCLQLLNKMPDRIEIHMSACPHAKLYFWVFVSLYKMPSVLHLIVIYCHKIEDELDMYLF